MAMEEKRLPGEPGAPPARRGSPFLPRNGEKEGRGPSVIGRWFRWNRCRVAPATWVPARLRAGARLSPEKAGGKSAGGLAPWTPFFYGPLVPTRSFWRLCRIVPVVGLFRTPPTCPDLERFFV